MNIPKDVTTRVYELTYLLPADLTKTELEKARATIDELVTKFNGKILETADWGKKTLAYRIRHKSKSLAEALYTHQRLEFDPAHLTAFEQALRLEGNTLRSLLVVSDAATEAVETPTETKAPKAKAPKKDADTKKKAPKETSKKA